MLRAVPVALAALVIQQAAPEPVSVAAAASCENCTITAEAVHRVPITGSFCEPLRLAWAGGPLAVAPCFRSGEVLLVDLDGTIVATLGGEGDGPGERRRVGGLAATPDSRVFVHTTTRIQTYQGDELREETSLDSFSFPHGMAATPDGGYIVASPVATPGQAAGLTLHKFNARGEPEFSFARDPIWRIDEDSLSARHVVVTADRIWSAKQFNDYLIEEWTLQGDLIQALRPEQSPLENPPWDTNEGAMVTGLAFDGELLWIAISVEDPGKRPERQSASETQSALDVSPHSYRNTVVEVIDPSSASVVARTVLDPNVGGLLTVDAQVWAWVAQDDVEPPKIELLRMSVAGYHH